MTRTTVADRPEVQSLAIHGGTPISDKPVSLISVSLSEEDINAAVSVLRSGMLAAGRHAAAFEDAFAAATDARHALTCANGTCALQLAYEPLIQPGDDVLVPGWTYIATVSMVVARGGNPIFVDADPETYNMDLADAARRITPKTTAIAATHLYGNPVAIDAVQKLASKHGLKVIYDAAQAHMATYQGKGLGAFGDAVTYSFYPTKNMTTGEGGMVTVNDEALRNQLRALRSHGEGAKYIHESIGYNYRMTDMEAAIGASRLTRLPQTTAARQANAAMLDRALADIDGLHAPTVTPEATSAYHLYAIRIDPEAFIQPDGDVSLRQLMLDALKAEGIMTAVHYPRPLTRQPVFEKPGIKHLPVSDRLAETLFCVPIHHNLTKDEVRRVGEALAKVAAAYRA